MAKLKYADWSEERKAQARKAAAKWRTANLEYSRAWAREYAAKKAAADPIGTKKYRRSRQIKKYGLTVAEYDAMLIAQDWSCAICETDEPGGHGRWQIDHCHRTKRARRLLCHYCNIGLGHFKEDIALLQRAIDYLKAWSW